MLTAIRLTLCATIAFTCAGCAVARTAAGILQVPLRLLRVENSQPQPKDALEADRGQQIAAAGAFFGRSRGERGQMALNTAAR